MIDGIAERVGHWSGCGCRLRANCMYGPVAWQIGLLKLIRSYFLSSNINKSTEGK